MSVDVPGVQCLAPEVLEVECDDQLRLPANRGSQDMAVTFIIREYGNELVEIRNHADGLIQAAEQQISEHGDKIPAADKAEIEQAIGALREAVKTEDVDDIRAKLDGLSQASMKIGQAIYQSGQADAGEAGQAGEAGEAAGSDETVVDADFEEVDDDDEKRSA